MFSVRFLVSTLTKLAAKFVIVTTILAVVTMYPLWSAILTGSFLYVGLTGLVPIEFALGGLGVLSFAHSVWMIRNSYKSNNG